MSARKEVTVSGVAVAPGLVSGPAFVYHDMFEYELTDFDIGRCQVATERERLSSAIGEVAENLRAMAERVELELDPAMGAIFRAHEQMLNDVTFTDEITTEIETRLVNAERAIQRVFGRWEGKAQSATGPAVDTRCDDIADLARRLMRSLSGARHHSLESMPEGSVLVARRLLPSDAAFLLRRSAAGVMVEIGGPASHCALLTRQTGIPGVAQLSDILSRVSTGDHVLLDGLRGSVTVAPTEESKKRFAKRMKAYEQTFVTAKQQCREPAITRGGVEVSVMANIGNGYDADMAAENGADGVGLFRIEVFFLSRSGLPREEELYDGISRTIAPMRGKPIMIRLLDIGGDKQLPYLSLPREENPFLGRRGVRLLLHYPELLEMQLRVLLRLSADQDIRILVPMVTVPDDVVRVRSAMERAMDHVGLDIAPPLGAMVETPAAALSSGELCAVSDFLSVGTNDLTQYTMAAGRENSLVSHYFMDSHPAVLRLLQGVVAEAGDTPVGICGELAGSAESVPLLVRAGYRILSVAPALVPHVKEAVRASA